MATESQIDRFPALQAVSAVSHLFVARQPGIGVGGDRAAVVEALRPIHERAIRRLGRPAEEVVCGEQIHGAEVAIADRPRGLGSPLPGVDGLVTSRPGLVLAVYVADCCAVYFADRRGRAIGLVHSGRSGTEKGIAVRAIERLGGLGVPPADLVVQLSPCIRPPRYEVDFASQIRDDCRAAGVPERQIHDSGVCTGSDLGRYYSYRVERGRTGRMLALLGLRDGTGYPAGSES